MPPAQQRKHTYYCICSCVNQPHGLWPTNLGGGWHSRAGGVKNTSSGSRAWAGVWGRGLRGWHGWRRLRVCVCTVYMCKRLQLHDSARLFQGGGVVKPAVLSIDCYFESPADGTAVSLRDKAFRHLCHSQARGGALGDTLLTVYD